LAVRRGTLAQVPRVAERVASWLRPDGQPMRLAADGNHLHRAGPCVDRVDDVVVASRKPQRLAVGADVAHVGAAAAWNRPVGFDLAGSEIEDRYAPLAMRSAMDLVGAAIGDVELLPVAAGIEAMRSLAGLDEADLPERGAVDD